MLESMPPISGGERRVVAQWPTGLYQILGITNEQPPTVIPVFESQIPLSLVQCTARYYLYRPIGKVEGLKDFNKEQQ
jgi:hypothetical protein